MALKSINFLGNKIYSKHKLISSLVRGKSVVHYGCVDDNAVLIDSKIKKDIISIGLLQTSQLNV